MISGFSRTLELFQSEVKGQLKQLVSEIRINVAEYVINKTPLDTGYARGNWQSSIGSPEVGEVTRYDREAGYAPTGGSGISMREAEEIAQQNIDKDFFVVNNAPYIMKLEFGGSKQAPEGMVRLTTADFPMIVVDAVNKVVK